MFSSDPAADSIFAFPTPIKDGLCDGIYQLQLLFGGAVQLVDVISDIICMELCHSLIQERHFFGCFRIMHDDLRKLCPLSSAMLYNTQSGLYDMRSTVKKREPMISCTKYTLPAEAALQQVHLLIGDGVHLLGGNKNPVRLPQTPPTKMPMTDSLTEHKKRK